jgi:putative nucleotidyltransferase with HDIG domain
LLGTGKLRNAVLGMSIARVWNRVKMPPSWSMARFNMHSAAVALLSDLLAQRLPVTYPEGAFVAGLLHDVGRLLLALGLPNEYARIVERYHSGNQTLVDCEREIVGFTHAELSAQALHAWKLPEEIQIAARDHHSSLLPAAQEIPLSRVVDAANQYANAARLTILVTNHDCDSALAVESLGLDPDELQALLAEFREENDAMAKFFH